MLLLEHHIDNHVLSKAGILCSQDALFGILNLEKSVFDLGQ